VSRHERHPSLECGDLRPEERRELLVHLQGCETCRSRWAAEDPSVLFSLLAIEPVPGEVLERVSSGVESAIAAEAEREVGRRWVAWGSLAASLLVATVLGAYLWNQAPITAPVPVADSAAAVGAPEPEATIPAGMIEFLESPESAEVVEMSVGDVEVVMIFDEAMEI
jgi:hypothetical protein